MANTVQNTLNKIGNTIEAIFGRGKTQQTILSNNSGTPSALEKYGMQARNYHLMRNEWKKDLQYTRALINAEYQIQTEFKIDGGDNELVENNEKENEKKLEKLNKQKQKIQDKINKLKKQ